MNEPSSLARNKAVFATSIGSVKRPNGTFVTKLALFSGVSSTPTKLENKLVPDRSGAMALTRMLSAPYSAANPFVACSGCQPRLPSQYGSMLEGRTFVTAPLLALYHTNPGLGLRLPVLEMLMMLPPPFFFICGTVARTERYMLLTLTLKTRSNSFSVTSSVGLFLYVVPALLTTISTRPHF